MLEGHTKSTTRSTRPSQTYGSNFGFAMQGIASQTALSTIPRSIFLRWAPPEPGRRFHYFQINTVHLKRVGANLRDLLDCKANIDFAYSYILREALNRGAPSTAARTANS
jgi:hypothetical protein